MPLSQEEIAALKARVARLREQRSASSSLSAKENATRANVGAGLPPGAKSVQQILDEINALEDPADQTVYWRENFAAIKRAQARQRFQDVAEGRQTRS